MICEQYDNYGYSSYIVYSKKEHTYDEHIIELLADLRNRNIEVVEKECYFEDHNDVGYSFVPYVVEWFENNVR